MRLKENNLLLSINSISTWHQAIFRHPFTDSFFSIISRLSVLKKWQVLSGTSIIRAELLYSETGHIISLPDIVSKSSLWLNNPSLKSGIKHKCLEVNQLGCNNKLLSFKLEMWTRHSFSVSDKLGCITADTISFLARTFVLRNENSHGVITKNVFKRMTHFIMGILGDPSSKQGWLVAQTRKNIRQIPYFNSAVLTSRH